MAMSDMGIGISMELPPMFMSIPIPDIWSCLGFNMLDGMRLIWRGEKRREEKREECGVLERWNEEVEDE